MFALRLVRAFRDFLFNQEIKLGVRVMRANGSYPNRRAELMTISIGRGEYLQIFPERAEGYG